MLIGEAPGETEEKYGVPFIGGSGELLNSLLREVGLARRKVYVKGAPMHDDRGSFTLQSSLHATNVLTVRPPGNDIKNVTVTKTDLKKLGFSDAGRLPKINNRYLHPALEPSLARLKAEISTVKPKLIIGLGGTALWALTGDSRISQYRGTFFPVEANGFHTTAITTFHPASILRQWEQRPIAWADLRKAYKWLTGTLPTPLTRTLYINPTLAEVEYVYDLFLARPDLLLGVDIETSPGCGQITTFSIGAAETAICIPVWNPNTLRSLSDSYVSPSEEAAAWNWIKSFCELPNPKVMQNGLYDAQYLLEDLDIRVRNVLHDTAIMQHAYQPELRKDLGTLASLYLNEPAWKFMRESAKDEKVDE